MTPPPKPAILPEPFEWIHIPAGHTTLASPYAKARSELRMFVEDFYMAKYPITNAQFGIYLLYTQRHRDQRFPIPWEIKQPHNPVIWVWWYEAMQFCEWLSNQTGYAITLPTDAQWQRAAQGDTNWRYPWGDEWNPDYCNSEHNKHLYTTPVTHYPQGASVYGVMDMAGNVCEWCLNDYETGEPMTTYNVPEVRQLGGESRTFRGGDYMSSSHSVQIANVGATFIDWDSYACGIRLVMPA
jgi:formylglycine-generating enzyme required for sulfatase activity